MLDEGPAIINVKAQSKEHKNRYERKRPLESNFIEAASSLYFLFLSRAERRCSASLLTKLL
jgi:hypothetical protein